MDLVIDKPASVQGYALHRIVEQTGGDALWAETDKQLIVRKRMAAQPGYEAGKLLVFDVTACVSFGRKHKYYHAHDWRSRRDWFHKQASKQGFDVLGVTVTGGRKLVEKTGSRFTVDATRFVGLLKVTDTEAFSGCLINGLGRVGKAFGLGLLIVN